METGQATVRKDGITKFNTIYVGDGLCYYIGRRVNIRWDRDDIAALHVYDPESGEKICVARAHEFMGMADRVSQDDLAELMRAKNTQKRTVRGRAAEMRDAYTFKCEQENATPDVVGALVLDDQPARQTVSLPQDKEYRRESIRNARGFKADRRARKEQPAMLVETGEAAWDKMFPDAAEG